MIFLEKKGGESQWWIQTRHFGGQSSRGR